MQPSRAPEKGVCRRPTRSVRERQLVEQLDYNLLLRWFVGFGMDDAV